MDYSENKFYRPARLPIAKALPQDHCPVHGFVLASTLHINELGYESKCPLSTCLEGVRIRGLQIDKVIINEEETRG